MNMKAERARGLGVSHRPLVRDGMLNNPGRQRLLPAAPANGPVLWQRDSRPLTRGAVAVAIAVLAARRAQSQAFYQPGCYNCS